MRVYRKPNKKAEDFITALVLFTFLAKNTNDFQICYSFN